MRALGDGEEPVLSSREEKEKWGGGKEKMVHHLVDARFAIYEEIDVGGDGTFALSNSLPRCGRDADAFFFDGIGLAVEKDNGVGSYQTLPLHLTSSTGTAPLSALIAFSLPQTPLSTLQAAQNLQSSFTTLFSSRAPPALKLYSSLYHHAGAEAQPGNHPVIGEDAIGGGEWLVLVLVVDGEGGILQVEHVRIMVGGFVKVQDMGVKWGVWKGEVFMS